MKIITESVRTIHQEVTDQIGEEAAIGLLGIATDAIENYVYNNASFPWRN